MDKELLDTMCKEGLISDTAYKEILQDIQIVEELNRETSKLKTELTNIKKETDDHFINTIISQVVLTKVEFNYY
ncbi:MAG: hypothetical protein HRT69_10565 [Flavobacteriaceae bacterium]|nr:hypothetical protein [Flavobacteriaceae bacterium]